MNDSFQTISKTVSIETKVKGSRFIGEVLPVEKTEQADSEIEIIRKREHSATHHCYAYRIGLEPNIEFKYSDDGEPNGTAGKPIYDCIEGRNLANILVVVTRYFGGTKLGTGGLARAYSKAAKQALEKSKIKTVYLTDSVNLKFDFSYYDKVQRLMNKFAVNQSSSEFTERVTLNVLVRKSLCDEFVNELTNLTSGQIEIERE